MRSTVTRLLVGGFELPESIIGAAGERVVVNAWVVRHPEATVLVDTGIGAHLPEEDLREMRFLRTPITDALATLDMSPADVDLVINCHLHVDHAGQNSAFTGIPIYVQPAEWEVAHTTEHTILEWIDFPGADYRPIAGDHEPVEGIRIIATPGHTVGHQSLVVATTRGDVVLAGQALYTAGEWGGDVGAREGRSRAPDVAAYDRSVERLKALDPAQVAFAHGREVWTRPA